MKVIADIFLLIPSKLEKFGTKEEYFTFCNLFIQSKMSTTQFSHIIFIYDLCLNYFYLTLFRSNFSQNNEYTSSARVITS